MGYTLADPLFVTAESVGASHKRERVFILGYAKGHDFWNEGDETMGHAEHGEARDRGTNGESGAASGERWRMQRPADTSGILGHPQRDGRRLDEPERGPDSGAAAGRTGGDLADPSSPRPQERGRLGRDDGAERQAIERSGLPIFAPGPGFATKTNRIRHFRSKPLLIVSRRFQAAKIFPESRPGFSRRSR